jgi:hypothetical protein
MIDLTDVEAARPCLALLCRDPGKRINPPAIDLPNDWRPFTVTHPTFLSRFNDAGAWEFIADCLEQGAPITCKPPSPEHPDHAYVMIEAGEGMKRVYMKIAIKPGLAKVVGISFHYEKTGGAG